MPRETIRLNPDKVKLHLARSGIPIKQLLDGMTAKTVYRIKAGENTSMATAEKLAIKLKTTVSDLSTPVNAENIGYFLPELWLYDAAPGPCHIKNHSFFGMAIEGGPPGYIVDGPPMCFKNPIEQLLKWRETRARKIVLRKEDHAYIFEIHYFYYLSDDEQTVKYFASTACRFFPLTRTGDIFSKTSLNGMMDEHVWGELQRTALANAELVSIEGHNYPDHPYVYFPLVRFYQGSSPKRMALGGRIFEKLHADFKWSMADYLEAIDPGRVSAKTTPLGIMISIAPIPPPIYTLGWRWNVLEIEVELVWRTPEGALALAPWRHAHREKFCEAITSRKWNACYSRGLPLCLFPKDGEDDPDTPPFEPDPGLSADTIAAINAITCPGLSYF